MKAENVGEKIIIEADYVETATLVDVLRDYRRKNPNAWDYELVTDLLRVLDNPTLKNEEI
jgi:hypothetical protein